MNNLKEFKELILKYENITLEELEKLAVTAFMSNTIILENITGFGSLETCILCTTIGANFIDRERCNKCTWKINTKNVCNQKENAPTYYAIGSSETLEDLLDAIQKRADYMRNVIDWFEEKN